MLERRGLRHRHSVASMEGLHSHCLSHDETTTETTIRIERDTGTGLRHTRRRRGRKTKIKILLVSFLGASWLWLIVVVVVTVSTFTVSTVTVSALPPVQEEDMTKHLFGANDETTYPVQEYLIHLAPEEDYTREARYRYDDSQHPHDHIQPYFLRSTSDKEFLSKPRVVNFYSPFCGHCQKFRPKYIALARNVNARAMVATAASSASLSKKLLTIGEEEEDNDNDNLTRIPTTPAPVPFYAISCAEFHKVCQDNHITGYPTIKVYPPGSVEGITITNITPEGIAAALQISLKKEGDKEKEVGERSDNDDMADADADDMAQLGRNRDHDALGMAYTLQRHTQKDTFFDAALSFSHGLKYLIYPPDVPDGTPLSGDRKQAFIEWIDLLYWALPPTWRLHIILHDVRSHYDYFTSSKSYLKEVVEHHHDVIHDTRDDNLKWTKSCRRPSQLQRGTIGQQKYKEWLLGTTDTAKVRENANENGHLCGLWSLLHIVSIGVSERYKAVLGDRDRVSTAHAAKTIRNYVELFLPSCPSCQQKFLQVYDSCGFNLCKRLKQPKQHTTYKNNHPNAKPHDSWNELALWIWELHNEVNVKLLREEYNARASAAGILSSRAVISPTAQQGQRDEPTLDKEHAVLWPSVTDCPDCWLFYANPPSKKSMSMTSRAAAPPSLPPYNKTAVYAHLKRHYWPQGPQHFRFVVLDKAAKNPAGSKLYKLTLKEEIHLFLITQPRRVVALLLLAYLALQLYHKWRRTLTGWHKKYDTDTSDGT
jgi:thiol-disulfide isomerase/thioredoxin